MIASPGVGASWVRSSGSSLSLVKRASPGSPATPALPAVKKLLMRHGLNSDSVCSKEKIVVFSSMSLQDWRRRAKWAGPGVQSAIYFCSLSPSIRWQRSPEDVVYAHNALRLGVAAVINNRSLRFDPDEASGLSQHTILTAHSLALGTHWGEKEGERESAIIVRFTVMISQKIILQW